MKNVLATAVGLVVAYGITTVLESLGLALFPPKGGVEYINSVWLRDHITDLSLGAQLVVLLAHLLGIMGGMVIAAMISKSSLAPSLIVASFMLLAAFINFILIRDLMKFMVFDLIVLGIGFYIGLQNSKKRITQGPDDTVS
ncbi:hypothetical protein [Aegicerativicinus sediminis]|uniref:hypothetical protein n=1 Tax=Aegicerativicinus sediminis TaxID=2893202 RepID=UPI001E44449A|nr:hypothetical protein [Aegicerativicinus sediminis]